MFKKILIANRGEIALRIICACKELGVRTVAIYSAADIANVDAIHPGYGLLSENANFAEVVETCGVKFIGPPPKVTRLMGEKEIARATMKQEGVPVLPGSEGILGNEAEAMKYARAVGFPVMLKASAGGGGRGMRIVWRAEDLSNLFHAAQAEAAAAFGNGNLYMEKYIERPRHIEFQVLGDSYGNVLSLGERECSIQRRHQKLIEESPSVVVTPELRSRMGQILSSTLSKIGYVNA